MKMFTQRIRIGLLAVLGAVALTGSLQAQRVDARDHLLYPVNPPRPAGSAPIRSDEKGNLPPTLKQIEARIMKLEKAGVPKSNPTLQSLYAQRAWALSKMRAAEPSLPDKRKL